MFRAYEEGGTYLRETALPQGLSAQKAAFHGPQSEVEVGGVMRLFVVR